MNIIVDIRERSSIITDAIESSGIKITKATLPVGDYAISERVCIERKTASDFESSLINGRLFEQMLRLKEAYMLPILLIEMGTEFRLGEPVITGAIASCYIDYRVMVAFSEDELDTASIICAIARHENEREAAEPSPKGGTRSFSDDQFRERVIANLPGIGLATARSLLEHFGSINAIATADENSLMDVPNIGKKRAKAILRILHDTYATK